MIYWEAIVVDTKPLRSSAGGDKINVVLAVNSTIRGDEKINQWIHLVSVNGTPVTYEGWITTAILGNLHTVEDTGEPPPTGQITLTVTPGNDQRETTFTNEDGTTFTKKFQNRNTIYYDESIG